jgi:hypothetical protein
MIESARGLRFALEPLGVDSHSLGIDCRIPENDLDRDPPVYNWVVSFVDHAHRTASEDTAELVPAKLGQFGQYLP